MAAAQAFGRPGGVNNTAYLFFVLSLAFIFYVTVKGDLPKWLGLFGLGAASSATSPASGGTAPAANGLPGLPAIPAIGANQIGTSPLSAPQVGGSAPATSLGGMY